MAKFLYRVELVEYKSMGYVSAARYGEGDYIEVETDLAGNVVNTTPIKVLNQASKHVFSSTFGVKQ